MIDWKNLPSWEKDPVAFDAYGKICKSIGEADRAMKFMAHRLTQDQHATWLNFIAALEKVNEHPDFPNTLVWPTPPDGWEIWHDFAEHWKFSTG